MELSRVSWRQYPDGRNADCENGSGAGLGCSRRLPNQPKHEEQSRAPQIRLRTAELSPSRTTSSDDSCGLEDFPASKPTQEILAAASRDGTRPPNQDMVAKVAVSAEGRVTHLRVLRLAWPKLPNSYAINEQAVDSIKGWRYR